MGRLQTIIKRLREIEELKDRRSQGVQLKPAQLEKIGREQELRDEWDSLRSEGAAAAAAPAPSAIAAAPSACFQIFYRYDGRTKTLNDVHPSDTIMSLMLKIEKKDGLPPERQIVRYAAQPLSTDDTVADSNIQKGATLMITVRWTSATSATATAPSPPAAPPVAPAARAAGSSNYGSAKNEIYVKTLTGTPVTMKFTDDCDISTQTLQTVTKAIEEQTGLPEYRYTLIFAGQQIPTDSESLLRTLGHYSIGQSSTLHIVEKLRIAIYVKPASGDVITINFSDGPVSTQTLLTVMNLIHRQLGVPVLMQRLIFAGKTLPTDRRSVEKTLSHYNIQLRATLHLVQVSAYPADRYPAVPITLTIIKKDGKLGRECPMDGKELVIGRRAAPRPQPPRRLCASRSQRRQAAHAVSPRARRDPDDLRPEVSEVSERQAKILRNDEHGLVPLPASCARAESPPPSPPSPPHTTRGPANRCGSST